MSLADDIRALRTERATCAARIAEIDQILAAVATELHAALQFHRDAITSTMAPLATPDCQAQRSVCEFAQTDRSDQDDEIPPSRVAPLFTRTPSVRMDETSAHPPRPQQASSGDLEQRILTTLRQAGGPMTPRALWDTAGVRPKTGLPIIYGLESKRLLRISGKTNSRRFELTPEAMRA